MKRITLTKYGFVRVPEEDFTDDGSRFSCYSFAESGSYVSKLVSNGQVYLSAHVYGNLPYEVYSKLPHYKRATWDFNGISVTSLTDDLLQDYYQSCVQYEKEYRETESQIEYPSIEAITEKCVRIALQRQTEISRVEAVMKKYGVDLITRFTSYDWSRVHECVRCLAKELDRYNPETYPATIVGKSTSFKFVEPTYEMGDSFWFKFVMEVFARYGMTA